MQCVADVADRESARSKRSLLVAMLAGALCALAGEFTVPTGRATTQFQPLTSFYETHETAVTMRPTPSNQAMSNYGGSIPTHVVVVDAGATEQAHFDFENSRPRVLAKANPNLCRFGEFDELPHFSAVFGFPLRIYVNNS
ncbi:MAG: hypothetical protein VX973_10735, partial [Pseudomonadota bacterium]|nr:hypothetical protein [Pseudomonadota bacterium]